MIKIEVLYKEYMNLYGDLGNIMYLDKCLGKNKIIYYTSLKDKPKFLNKKIDMLFLGPTTESHQEEIIKLLLPYKDKLKELINNNTLFLGTGNALEIFGKYIEDIDGQKIKALGIFNIYAKRVKDYRYNALCLGVTKDGLEIVGFKNQMSHLYGKDNNYFQDMFLGTGRNKDTKIEGIYYKNFIGTYILGPILPLNPYFTKFIMKRLGIKNPKLIYEEDAVLAYEVRLKEFRKLIKDI